MLDQNYTIQPIPAFQDNYIWIIVNKHNNKALVIDPGDAQPVLAYLNQHHLELRGILLTHHHWDHTNGVSELLRSFKVPVIASESSCLDEVTYPVSDGQCVTIEDGFPFMVALAIPGHTLDHMAYHMANALFCGDTLFGAGCGRLFEGTPEQMYHSLQKLAALPKQTQIYCGHEYTLANLHFAAMVEPSNQAIDQRIDKVKALRKSDIPSLPSVLKDEIATNPFLRCHIPEVIQSVTSYLKYRCPHPIDVFAALREWKNNI